MKAAEGLPITLIMLMIIIVVVGALLIAFFTMGFEIPKQSIISKLTNVSLQLNKT